MSDSIVPTVITTPPAVRSESTTTTAQLKPDLEPLSLADVGRTVSLGPPPADPQTATAAPSPLLSDGATVGLDQAAVLATTGQGRTTSDDPHDIAAMEPAYEPAQQDSTDPTPATSSSSRRKKKAAVPEEGEEEKPIIAQRFKTKLCRNYELKNTCSYAHRCMFAHGERDLRTEAQNMADGLTTEEAVKRFQRRIITKKQQKKAEAAAAAAAAALAAEGGSPATGDGEVGPATPPSTTTPGSTIPPPQVAPECTSRVAGLTPQQLHLQQQQQRQFASLMHPQAPHHPHPHHQYQHHPMGLMPPQYIPAGAAAAAADMTAIFGGTVPIRPTVLNPTPVSHTPSSTTTTTRGSPQSNRTTPSPTTTSTTGKASKSIANEENTPALSYAARQSTATSFLSYGSRQSTQASLYPTSTSFQLDDGNSMQSGPSAVLTTPSASAQFEPVDGAVAAAAPPGATLFCTTTTSGTPQFWVATPVSMTPVNVAAVNPVVTPSSAPAAPTTTTTGTPPPAKAVTVAEQPAATASTTGSGGGEDHKATDDEEDAYLTNLLAGLRTTA